MKGLFITFEGTEGSGKSTQISILAERLRELDRTVLLLREPGGTPIGEEIRTTLKHSKAGATMTFEAELLLMNASRAQLVRQVIRPALTRGEIILCDRFYDSTTVYQGYGRQLDSGQIQTIIEVAVGTTRPDLTLLLQIPHDLSERRRLARQPTLPLHLQRDRFEEAGQSFFQRVERGYAAIAAAEPDRIKIVDATGPIDQIAAAIWERVQPLLK